MSRPLRIEFPGAKYHVMSRGVNRCPIFHTNQDRFDFLGEIERVVQKGALIVHAYCLMTNHFHMLCETPEAELNRWMQQILSRYTQRFNVCHERVGHLWQARYKAILVEDGQYFMQCSRYIHLNPVHSGISQQPVDFFWSSYRNFVGGRCAAPWIETSGTMRYFRSVQHYRSFVEASIGKDVVNPFEVATAGLVYGSDSFLEAMRARIEGLADNGDMPTLRQLRTIQPIQPACLIEKICAIVDGTFANWSEKKRRPLLAYALCQNSSLKNKDIAVLLKISPSAVSHNLRKMEQRKTRNSDLAESLRCLAVELINGRDRQ